MKLRIFVSFRVNHVLVEKKKQSANKKVKFEYWDKTSWLNFTIESNFRPWIISKLLRSWKQAFFYNRLTHKRVFYGYCKLVAQNFSTREIDFGYYFFQTAYYISKLILPRIVRNLHFWKILFSSMYLDESETL